MEITEEIKELIDYLVNLGGDLYPILLQQVKYKAVINSFWFGIGFFGLFIAVFLFKSIGKYFKEENIDWDEDGGGFLYIVPVLIFIVSIALIFENGSSLLNYLMNPNWMVIQLLINQG